jgi:hypothetical protein
MANTERKGEE